jgi:hypothetical protein
MPNANKTHASQLDPDEGDGPALPTRDSDEYRPFARRLPEFKFWCVSAPSVAPGANAFPSRYTSTKAVIIAIGMSFFRVFDVPVFWPILLLYFIVLFVITMKRQIKHMIKHKYIPFDFGKMRYRTAKPSEKAKK